MTNNPTVGADLKLLIRHLFKYGYFHGMAEVTDPATGKVSWPLVADAGYDTIAAALDRFHARNGLKPVTRAVGTSLWATDEAFALMDMPRCGVPEFATVAELKWQLPATLTYYDDVQLPGFTTQRIRELIDEGWRQWGVVCGIRGTRVLDPRQANVIATARAIDGPGGTLAYAYFPTTGAPGEQRDQVIDPADTQYFQGLDGKNFLNMYTHELGHSLGFQHGPSGQCNMSPYLVPQYWAPQETYDIPTGVASYGGPLPGDPDEPPPPIDPQPPIDPPVPPTPPVGSPPSFVAADIF